MEDLKLLDKKVNFYENYTSKLKQLVEEDAKKMLKRLWAENDKLAEGRKKKRVPGLPEEEENDKSLTEIEEMSNEGA